LTCGQSRGQKAAPRSNGAADNFRRVNVPVLGIIANMSYFLCPQCGTRSDIFSHGGARHEADRLGVPFLGEVPLHMDIREKSDSGLPLVATEIDGK
jgi:ATP-binding protein involved in chromosome partitioning